MTTNLPDKSPWPGPRPYGWEDRGTFRGRDLEITEIANRLLKERLVILTGPSGAGKTSLLRAGVLPVLSELRQEESKTGRITVGLPLLLREWNRASGDADANKVLIDLLKAAAEDARNRKPSDGVLPSTTNHNQGPIEFVRYVCDKLGGIIIVFDQFEELLRRKNKAADGTIAFMNELFRSEPRAKMLVSLREEFHSYLRKLEFFVGGVYGRTYFLAPLSISAAEEAIGKSVEADETAGKPVKVIFGLLDQWQNSQDARGQAHGVKQYADLLSLQAVLAEYYNHCKKHGLGLTLESLEDYRKGRGAAILVGESLQRWIDSSLEHTSASANQRGSPFSKVAPQEQTRTIGHCMSRVANMFSSAGFKVPVGEDELLSRAMDEDWRVILPQITNARHRREYVANLKTGSEQTASLSEEEKRKAMAILSGIARDTPWSLGMTLVTLNGLVREGLERLSDGNVIRPSENEAGERIWELVHDGFGDPFIDWAEGHRWDFDDALASFTLVSGQDIKVKSGSPTLEDLEEIRGLNCHGGTISPYVHPEVMVEGREGHAKATFASKDLINCTFTGTVFDKCVFEDVSFQECDIRGGLFDRCTLRNVEFKKCRTDGALFLAGSLGNVKFLDTNLTQVSFVNLEQEGQLLFSASKNGPRTRLDSTRWLSIRGSPDSQLIFEHCDLQYCSWEKALTARKVERDSTEFNCGEILRKPEVSREKTKSSRR